MKLLDLLAGGFETGAFPEWECTIPNEWEPDVTDSNVWYLCLTVDNHFTNVGGISVLKPYTALNLPECVDEGGHPILYGWADKDGNFFDHFEQNVHDDHLVVVAWKRLDGPVDLWELTGIPAQD